MKKWKFDKTEEGWRIQRVFFGERWLYIGYSRFRNNAYSFSRDKYYPNGYRLKDFYIRIGEIHIYLDTLPF